MVTTQPHWRRASCPPLFAVALLAILSGGGWLVGGSILRRVLHWIAGP